MSNKRSVSVGMKGITTTLALIAIIVALLVVALILLTIFGVSEVKPEMWLQELECIEWEDLTIIEYHVKTSCGGEKIPFKEDEMVFDNYERAKIYRESTYDACEGKGEWFSFSYNGYVIMSEIIIEDKILYDQGNCIKYHGVWVRNYEQQS